MIAVAATCNLARLWHHCAAGPVRGEPDHELSQAMLFDVSRV
jgi:hypothetical protein